MKKVYIEVEVDERQQGELSIDFCYREEPGEHTHRDYKYRIIEPAQEPIHQYRHKNDEIGEWVDTSFPEQFKDMPQYEVRTLFGRPPIEAPSGWKLVPIEPTNKQLGDTAFNLCDEFGVEFVQANEAFARAVYDEMLAAAPGAEG